MPWPTSTAWPTSNDASYGSGAARVDAADIVWARDVNFLYTQTSAFQAFLGRTGELIGEQPGTGNGPGGLISPNAPGADLGIELATWDEYIGAGGNDVFRIVDDRSGTGAGPTTVLTIDDAGIMSLLGGIDIGSTEYLEIPHGNALPLTFEEGRLFRKDDTDTLYHADGAGWNRVSIPGEAVASLNESVTMGGVATEVIIGQTTYNGSLGSSFNFKAIIEPDAAVTCEIRLYDRGPVAGPPVAAVMAAKLATASAGLQVLSETLTPVANPVPGWPDSNEIFNTDRMYEIRGYINGAPGDILYVGKVTISVA